MKVFIRMDCNTFCALHKNSSFFCMPGSWKLFSFGTLFLRPLESTQRIFSWGFSLPVWSPYPQPQVALEGANCCRPNINFFSHETAQQKQIPSRAHRCSSPPCLLDWMLGTSDSKRLTNNSHPKNWTYGKFQKMWDFRRLMHEMLENCFKPRGTTRGLGKQGWREIWMMAPEALL